MAIPDYQTIMLPFLKLLADKEEHSKQEVVETLAKHFALTPEDRLVMIPSGRQELFSNRVGWARTYLVKALLIESTGRGTFCISERGQEVLKRQPTKIDRKYLSQFKEFIDFIRNPQEIIPEIEKNKPDFEETPEVALDNAYKALRNQLADELLQKLKSKSVTPKQFEGIVIDVIVAMGYGGSKDDATKALGKPHDEGIDGTIKADKLGLDIIYVQAKKWDGTVGRPEIQKFAGALLGQRARKGVFITTSDFSREALDYPNHIESKIILIDGKQLVENMINNNIGVYKSINYELKKLDMDYFIEE